MRRSFLILPVVLLFTLRANPQATIGIECDNSWGPGRYNKVTVSFTFSSNEGFARFTQNFPQGFEIIENEANSADLSVSGTKLIAVWMRIPQNKKTNISYYIRPDNGMNGNIDLEGSLDIITGGREKHSVTIEGKTVLISGSNGILPGELKSKSKNQIVTDVTKSKAEENPALSGIIFRIQVSTSSTMKPEEMIKRELGIEPQQKITIVKSGNIYKYQLGAFTDYDSAFKLLTQLMDRGLSDSFIVAYSGNEQIPVEKTRIP